MENDITERIEQILKVYELTPSAFSDTIQVQRSALSHILSRRNRPSLDVIQKILKEFPEINSQWLLTGIGKMKQLSLFEEEDKNSREDTSPKSQDKPESKSIPAMADADKKNTIEDLKGPAVLLTESFKETPAGNNNQGWNTPLKTEALPPVFTTSTQVQPPVNQPQPPAVSFDTPPIPPVPPTPPTPEQNFSKPPAPSYDQPVYYGQPPVPAGHYYPPPAYHPYYSPGPYSGPPPFPSSEPNKEEPPQTKEAEKSPSVKEPEPGKQTAGKEEAKALAEMLGEKEIDKIVIFYKDRTFVSYKPE